MRALLQQMRWRHARDTLLFLGGLAGVLHEAIFTSQDRPDLLIVFAAMMGLPAFFNVDRRNGNGNGKDKE